MSKAPGSILFLSQGADFYGSNLILLQVAKHLKEAGYTIHVVFSLEGPIIQEFEKAQISSEVINLGVLRRSYVSFFGLFNWAYDFISALIRGILLVKKGKFDIVYSNGLGILIGVFAARLSSRKHIWHVHEIIPKPKYFFVTYRLLLNWRFSQNIVVSEAVRSFWATGVASNFHLIYNGIPLPPDSSDPDKVRQELGLAPDTLLIGMIGRVSRIKGQDYFLKIAAELLKTNSNLKFLMVGDAYPGNENLYVELQELKEFLGISNAVFDLGFRRDIPDILASLDLFVMPSVLPDSFPTVILEAMQQRKAIVATRQGGAQEMLIDNVSGVFIPINDEKAACKIISPLLQDRSKRIAMGLEGEQKLSKDFSPRQFKEKLLSKIRYIQEYKSLTLLTF